MDTTFYRDLRDDELQRANVEVIRPLFGFTLPIEALRKCAIRLGTILADQSVPLSDAIAQVIRIEFPDQARRGSRAKEAYDKALRAAIWFRYYEVRHFVEGKDGTDLPRPFGTRCSLIKDPRRRLAA